MNTKVSHSKLRRPLILHLTGMAPTKFGGMEAYLNEVARFSYDLGYHNIFQYENLPSSKEIITKFSESGADVMVTQTTARSFFSLMNLISLLACHQPAIIQTHFSERHVVMFAGAFGRFFGARKVVSMIHNVHHLKPNSLARYAYNRCDHVLGVSQAVCDDLMKGAVSPSKIKRHYLGVSRSICFDPVERVALRLKYGIKSSALVIGNISFDAPFKGIDLLLEALSLIYQDPNIPEVYLLQIGVEQTSSELPHIAEKLGISHRIIWGGVVDNGCKLLNAVDLYVQSSRYGEGLPLSILEAMATSLPVVATGVSGNQEAVVHGKTGLLCNPNDPEKLANAIKELLLDPHARSTFGTAGLSRCRDFFDQSNSVRNLVEDVYQLKPRI